MKTALLSNKWKKVGWFLFIPALILGLFTIIFDYEFSFLEGKMISIFPTFFENNYFQLIKVNFTHTILGVAFIVGGLLVGFSKEEFEDEFIEKLRLSSLSWAVVVNYVLLILAFIFIYDTTFLNIMIYNMFTILLIFIFRFNFILFISQKSLGNEK